MKRCVSYDMERNTLCFIWHGTQRFKYKLWNRSFKLQQCNGPFYGNPHWQGENVKHFWVSIRFSIRFSICMQATFRVVYYCQPIEATDLQHILIDILKLDIVENLKWWRSELYIIANRGLWCTKSADLSSVEYLKCWQNIAFFSWFFINPSLLHFEF